jgi:hypothetical protein
MFHFTFVSAGVGSIEDLGVTMMDSGRTIRVDACQRMTLIVEMVVRTLIG